MATCHTTHCITPLLFSIYVRFNLRFSLTILFVCADIAICSVMANAQQTNQGAATATPTEDTHTKDGPADNSAIDPGFCIVQPEEPASEEIFADFRGRRFYFCCESCRTDFLSDPSRFASLAEQRDAAERAERSAEFYNPDRGGEFDDSFWGWMGGAYLWFQKKMSRLSVAWQLQDPVNDVLVAACVFLAVFWLAKWRWRRRRSRRRSRLELPAHGVWIIRCLVVGLLISGFIGASYRRRAMNFQTEYRAAETERSRLSRLYQDAIDRDSIHYATFMNFGFPPRPLPSTQPVSLSKTYYRGNDERAPEMFNGGNYRTVTFELSLLNDDGSLLTPGDSIQKPNGSWRSISLFVRFLRSPDTSSGYFTADYMKRMYLTQTAGEFLGAQQPIGDRVDWKMTQKNQAWEAEFQLDLSQPMMKSDRAPPPDPSQPEADAEGLVYLCEERYEASRLLGGRYHYAVQYRLYVDEKGRVVDSSDLWMGAMYRGRNFGDLQIEPQQWLSDTPLPEKNEPLGAEPSE